MPFVEDDIGPMMPIPEAEEDLQAEAPSIGETFMAGFRQENSIVSAAAKGFNVSPHFQPEEGYDPYDEDIQGYETFAESFIESKSSQETAHIKAGIDQELEDRKTLSEAGFTGIVAQFAAGLTDPIYLPLMATGLGSIRIGSNAAKAFGKTASIGAISELPAEAAKQSTQETRTVEESLFNIGGSAILSGLLGAGVAKLSPDRFDELSIKAEQISSEAPDLSMGAAEVPQLSAEDLELVNIGRLEKLGVSPLVRTQTSPDERTRRVASAMMETPLISKGNIQGVSTTPEGGSVETRIKRWNSPMVESLVDVEKAYTRYRQGKGAITRTINDYVMRNRAGKLSYSEFREEVGRSARRGDKSSIPEVQEAAQSARKTFDALKDAAIEAGQLPHDVEVKTATSYLTRIYNQKKITAKRPEWDTRVQDWLSRSREKAIDDLPSVAKEADQIIGGTSFDPEDAIGSAASIGRDMDDFLKRTGKDLADQVSEVEGIRKDIADLKASTESIKIDKDLFSKKKKGLESELKSFREDLSKAISERRDLEDKLKASKRALREASEKSDDLKDAVKASADHLGEKLSGIAKIREDIAGKKNRLANLEDDLIKEKKQILKSSLIEKRKDLSLSISKRRDFEKKKTEAGKKLRKLRAKIGDAGISDAEIVEISDAITDNILGHPGGRIPYESVQLARGPLKERTFNIPDKLIEDFLESDIDIVMRQYVRTMAPDVEIARRFGDIDLKSDMEMITDSYTKAIKDAKTEKERIALEVRMKADIRDLAAMRDRLRGTYRSPEDPNSFFIRAGKVLRDVNFLRMLGGMTISAIPDLARPIAVNGLMPFSRSLIAMASSPSTFKMAREEAKKAAVGLDMVLNSRASSMAELSDIYARGTKFERGLSSVSDAFGKITLMSQWNAAIKQFTGVMTQDRIIQQSINWTKGNITKSNMRRLASSGIDEGMAKRIASQFKKHGTDGTIKLSHGHRWDDLEALDTLRSSVLKDVDRAILTVGEGEKPLWTSSEVGKMIFQFKSFASASHHKILLADLQHRDFQALSGFLISVGLGTMTYGLKQYFADKPISKKPEKIIVESLDRSGAFGYFWDVNNVVEKITRGNFGVNPALGSQPMSRYATRNALGAALGPSFGTAGDILTLVGAASEAEMTKKDASVLRRMLPAQNLFYMRRLFNSIEDQAAKSLPDT